MKKIYTVVITLIVGLSIYANPIPVPTIEMSELFFDETDNWKIELGYNYIDPDGYTFDSIFLYSSKDTVKVPDYTLTGEMGQFVLTIDSLNSNFRINRLGDIIKVVSYSYGAKFEDILIFGNVSGASISYPRIGQSISKYCYRYVKDKSPSLGEPNDTIGMCGTIRGMVYDKYSEPVQNRIFQLDNNFEISTNGEYMTRVYSKQSTFDRINYKTGKYSMKSVSITEISYTMEPDSIIEMDIHLLDTLTTGISEITLVNTPITIYPNPVSINETININIDLPIFTSDIFIEISDLNGKPINRKKVYKHTSTIDVPSKGGLYIVSAWLDSQIISSKRILVND
jgi:hypothetical protein